MLWIHKGKRTYYAAWVYRDLLGDWVLRREWGSLDTKRGGEKTELLLSFEEGLSRLDTIAKTRLAHHYQQVDTQH